MNIKDRHKVLGVRHLTENTFCLRVERDNFEFVPGQCVNIGLSKTGINREYSSYSSVNDDKEMEFLIRAVENGAVSNALRWLKKGDYVQLDGAYGKFTLKNPADKKNKYIFIATGTGIAPFHSFAMSYPGLNYKILHGVRNVSEQYDSDDYKTGSYVGCVSRLESPKSSKTQNEVFSGRVTNYLMQKGVDKTATYYLCGNTDMINEVYDILRENGVNGDKIFTEVFF